MNPIALNTHVSVEELKKAFALVESNYRNHKDIPYEDYECIALFKVCNLKKYGKKAPLTIKKNDGTFQLEKELPVNAQNIPFLLLLQARHSKKRFLHVLVQRRIFYDGSQRIALTLSPNQKTLGFFSDSPDISRLGINYLTHGNLLTIKERVIHKIHTAALQLLHAAYLTNAGGVMPRKKVA